MEAGTKLKIVGLIPARGGSKRIPGKNIKLCAGKPLVLYACEAALESRYLNRIIVSTDDFEIKKLAQSAGVEVPFLRPESISRDDTPMIDVVRHAYKWLSSEDSAMEAVVLLQPTSPLREKSHIDGAIEIFQSHDVDSVVSVVRIPHIFHPNKVFISENGILKSYLPTPLKFENEVAGPVYARNGPAVLVLHPRVLSSNSLYGTTSAGYEMSQENSIDIDTPVDFAIAERLLLMRTAQRLMS